MKTFHYYWEETYRHMPKELKEEYHLKLEYPAIDGYMRPRCTSIVALVDCKLCLAEMRKKNIKTTQLDIIAANQIKEKINLIPEIKEYFKDKKITISEIQRHFKLGYNTAFYLYQHCL